MGLTTDHFIFPLSKAICLTFRHRASCILGQAFHYSPENAFYIFNQQIKKLRGLSPQANYTNRAAAAGRRS